MKSVEQNVLPRSEYFVHSPSSIAREAFYYPIHVGHFFYDTGYYLKRNAFNSFLILYVLDGEMILNENGNEITIGKDQFLFLDCYSNHTYYTRRPCETVWMHFDGQNTRQLYEMTTERVGKVFSLYDPLPVTGKVARIFEAFKSRQPIREGQFSRWIYDMLMDIYLFAKLEGPATDRTAVIAEVTAYINDHFQEDPSVEALAKIASLSPYHFIRVFKKETGMTPHEYIVDLKIRTAKYLLKNTTIPVKDICFEAGFSGESVLCSTFKRITGYSPTAYRLETETS